jgi:hypothetical protein
MAVCFWLRFRSGKWKTMRVIEAVPPDEPAETGIMVYDVNTGIVKDLEERL